MLRTLHSFLSSRLLQNHFLRRFLWPNFDLNSFESFVSLYQKTVSTLLLKNLQKIKKWHFQMFTTFAFDLKVASKPSNLKSFDFLPHFPHLPHMVAEKFAKTWKMRFWNALEIEYLLKLASKPFFKMLPMSNCLESFVSLCLNAIWISTLRHDLNFAKMRNALFKRSEYSIWTQYNFTTIFYNASYGNFKIKLFEGFASNLLKIVLTSSIVK